MRAHAVVVACPGPEPDHVRYRTLRSDPPLLLRPTPAGLHLVGGAAGPLGGDDLDLEIVVEAGAHLCVRSVAATIVLPGADVSDIRVRAHVEAGGCLDWAPEPMVSVLGSRHRQRSDVTLAHDARMRWTETLVLGRSDEEGGAVDATLRLERAGRPVVHQQLACGPDVPGWDGATGLGGHRVVATTVTVGADGVRAATHHDESTGARGMAVVLEPGVTLAQAVAGDVPAAAAVLTSLAIGARPG